MRPLRFLTLIAVLPAIFMAGPIHAAESTGIDQWFGLYRQAKKVGYEHITVGNETFEGKKVIARHRIRRENLSEEDHHWCYTEDVYVNAQFRPIFAVFTGNNSDTDVWRVEARFNPQAIQSKKTHNGKTINKFIKIPKGTDLSVYWKYRLGRMSIPVGKQELMPYFDYELLSINNVRVDGILQEDLDFDGGLKDMMVVREYYKCPEVAWRLEDGRIAKIDITDSGYKFRPEAKDTALSDGVSSPVVKGNCPKPIAGNLSDLTVRLVDIFTYGVVRDDSRQKMTRYPDKGAIEFHVTAKGFDASKGIKFPVTSPDYVDYLKEEPGIEVNDESIKQQAKAIVGEETNAYEAACKIQKWLYDNINTNDEFVNESAVDVLRTHSGVCRHNAFLFTALARSVGIPTRVATGLLYSDEGFYAHAWVECFVGEWVPFDSTCKDIIVNADHIKLRENDLNYKITGGKSFAAEILSAAGGNTTWSPPQKPGELATYECNGITAKCPIDCTMSFDEKYIHVTLSNGSKIDSPIEDGGIIFTRDAANGYDIKYEKDTNKETALKSISTD